MPLSLRTALPLLVLAAGATARAADASPPGRTVADVIQGAPAADWRPLQPQDTLLMELPQGQVIIELAARFAPRHAANLRTLAHEGYFDGLAIIRVQDNYVTQWGDPQEDDAKARPLGGAAPHLPAEFSVPLKGLPLQRLPDADGWAPVTGFVDGMPVAADPESGQAWVPHCYGVVGAARGQATDSSNGSGLYVVIGQSPRGLDLNITVVGRVLQGMEWLAALPRGSGALGFYDKPEQRTPIRRVRLLADVPAAERPALEVMRTDSASWTALLDARRVRREDWFVHSARHINVCNASVPVRLRPATPAAPAAPAAAAAAAPAASAAR